MPSPNPADSDVNPGRDFRVITPSTEYLNPTPRAICWIGAGAVVMECPDRLPPISNPVGAFMAARPLRILPETTATVLALY